jgi:hypothetical protein
MPIKTHNSTIKTNNSNWEDDNYLPPDLYLYTVPHTGTTFAMKFLKIIGFNSELRQDDGKNKYFALHSIPNYLEQHPIHGKIVTNHPLEYHPMLVTARNPYDCLLSHIARYENDKNNSKIFNEVCERWDLFLETISMCDHVILNIDWTSSRWNKIHKLIHFLKGDDAIYDTAALSSFVNEWKAENSYSTKGKNPYLLDFKERDRILDQFDLSRLSDALSWYDSTL